MGFLDLVKKGPAEPELPSQEFYHNFPIFKVASPHKLQFLKNKRLLFRNTFTFYGSPLHIFTKLGAHFQDLINAPRSNKMAAMVDDHHEGENIMILNF